MVEPIGYKGGMVHLWGDGQGGGECGVLDGCAVCGIVCVAGESTGVDREQCAHR